MQIINEHQLWKDANAVGQGNKGTGESLTWGVGRDFKYGVRETVESDL